MSKTGHINDFEGKSIKEGKNIQMESSRDVVIRDIKAFAPISRIETLRDDKGLSSNVGQALPDNEGISTHFNAPRTPVLTHSTLSLQGEGDKAFTTFPLRGRAYPVRSEYGGHEVRMRGDSAFTLIELLVVVLIIAILAAIALPQYQKAVRRSLYAGMLPILKSVVYAQEAYYLTHGAYAVEWDQLDIQIPNGGTCSMGNAPSKAKCRLVISDKVCACLGSRGINTVPAVMVGFSVTSSVKTPNGYEYVFDRVQINQTLSNRIAKGLYCRESASGTRDYHCTGRAGRQDWYGRWFYMD